MKRSGSCYRHHHWSSNGHNFALVGRSGSAIQQTRRESAVVVLGTLYIHASILCAEDTIRIDCDVQEALAICQRTLGSLSGWGGVHRTPCVWEGEASWSKVGGVNSDVFYPGG